MAENIDLEEIDDFVEKVEEVRTKFIGRIAL